MSFWHTVLAVVLGHALYDLAWMLIRPDGEDSDDPDCAA